MRDEVAPMTLANVSANKSANMSTNIGFIAFFLSVIADYSPSLSVYNRMAKIAANIAAK